MKCLYFLNDMGRLVVGKQALYQNRTLFLADDNVFGGAPHVDGETERSDIGIIRDDCEMRENSGHGIHILMTNMSGV